MSTFSAQNFLQCGPVLESGILDEILNIVILFFLINQIAFRTPPPRVTATQPTTDQPAEEVHLRHPDDGSAAWGTTPAVLPLLRAVRVDEVKPRI